MQAPTLSGLGLPVLSPDIGEDKAVPLIRLQKNCVSPL